MLKRKINKDKNKGAKAKSKKKGISQVMTTDLLPVLYYDDEIEAFALKDNKYMDIIKVTSRDLENMSDDEFNIELLNLVKIYKTVGIDLKFISLNFPLNTSIQQETLLRYKEKANDEVKIKWINRQLNELNRAETGVLTREFYVKYFGDNKNDFIKNKELVSKYMLSGSIKLCESLSKEEKINIETKLSNMNTNLVLKSDQSDFEENIVLRGKNKEKFDKNLFEAIQPKGGVSFREPSYIRFGDGYVRCLHVYALPSYISEFWLISLFNKPNCICTFDVSSKDLNVVKKNINKSITEENSRGSVAKKYDELYEAEKRKEELKALYDEISRLGEVVKACDFRIYVKAKTLVELDEETAEIINNLEGDSYKTTVMLNEQKREWLSLFESAKTTHSKPCMMKSLNLTSNQLAMGYPFNYSELLDDDGVLLGFSKSGGVILYDPFAKTRKRKHYNSIVCGDMGSGKSAHLKKLFKHQASIGNFVRVFDVSGEFKAITKEFGGKIIKCSTKEGMLNPLEILKSGENNDTSYTNHITKLQTFFKCIIPSMSDDLCTELANYLRGFYEIYNLTPERERDITGRNAEEYPILADFKVYLEKEIELVKKLDEVAITDVETNLNIDKAKSIYSILSAVENLISNYGSIFNGKSAINNITDEKIVCFDISTIKDLGNVFTAQMQNLVSLCWDNAVNNGEIMKSRWEEDKDLPSHEFTKFLVLIDESHIWVNTSMPLVIDMIARYMREARKYFAGIVLASQSVKDFIPESSSENLEKIKTIFELAQYKFMFKQDSSVKEHIKNKFGFSLTMSQVDQIPFLEVGETIMSIAGDSSIEFKEWLSMDYEEKLFAGGM